MTYVHSNAWYLQWYFLAGIAFFLYGLAYAWYFALGARTPVGWVKHKLMKRRQVRAKIRQDAEFEARKIRNAEKIAEFERGKAAKMADFERQKAARAGITIDAEPDSIDRTSAT